jgi:hypothetical protein
MFVYVKNTSKKRKKPTAKQRELQADWENLLKKYPTKNLVDKKRDLSSVYSLGITARRETPKIPSLPFTGGPCLKKEYQTYTGDKIKGIGTMHKSNAVPIFSDEEAVDIAKMRR